MTYHEWQERFGRPETKTAREILEARLGRPLGPISTMPRDLRNALSGLAKQLTKMRNA